jgi:hypothetical protein
MLKKATNTILYVLISTFSLSQFAKAEIIEVNFIYVGEKDHAALLGVKQGLEEANLQGQFLNQKYSLDVVSSKDISTYDFSKYIAVLNATDATTFKKLTSDLPSTPVFNLTLSDDDLRTACLKNGLHIIPSNSMAKDAITQWKQKKSESKANAQAWHPDFVKFAARDLNKRFKKAHGVVMNDFSWSGWAAVKMTSDAVARTQITDSDKMLNYLKTELVFDGQKGSDMNFRKTGQLRQLLLLIENDQIVAEAPVRGVAIPPTLDSLGLLDCNK